MQKLESLLLPKQLPALQALKSWNQNEHNYEPEFWEFQYEIYRYLKNVDNEGLINRYKDIHRNFRILVRPERDVIPINSFLSSWYWYRKEHQTRYEISLRELPLPLQSPAPRGALSAPLRPHEPNSCDLLFRYGDSIYMKPFVESGKIRVKRASSYKDGPVSDPRTDDELKICRRLSGQHTRITSKEGTAIPFTGDIQEIFTNQTDYYALCMSSDFEPYIFDDFSYDSCVIIKNPQEFMARLEASSKGILANWYVHHNPVEYFDPYETYESQSFDPVMCKDFRFAYQMEYRVIWHPQWHGRVQDYLEISVGSLEDICELYIR